MQNIQQTLFQVRTIKYTPSFAADGTYIGDTCTITKYIAVANLATRGKTYSNRFGVYVCERRAARNRLVQRTICAPLSPERTQEVYNTHAFNAGIMVPNN